MLMLIFILALMALAFPAFWLLAFLPAVQTFAASLALALALTLAAALAWRTLRR